MQGGCRGYVGRFQLHWVASLCAVAGEEMLGTRLVRVGKRIVFSSFSVVKDISCHGCECVCVYGEGEYKGGVWQNYVTFFYTFPQVSSGAEFVVAESSYGAAGGKC